MDGGLKVFKYEADGIVPFVANSPFMSFLYKSPAPEYKKHMNAEGQLIPANRAWHERNGTYAFSYGLGAVIVLYGLLLCLHPWKPEFTAIGSFLVVIMSLVTLSFLITTPETWVPALGDAQHGFPYLSGRGRLVIIDAIMLGAAMGTMGDSARAYLRNGCQNRPRRLRPGPIPSKPFINTPPDMFGGTKATGHGEARAMNQPINSVLLGDCPLMSFTTKIKSLCFGGFARLRRITL